MKKKSISILKTFPAAVFALALFFAVAGGPLIKTVKGWHPSELDGFIPPTISIENPRNQSYIDAVPLSFIAKGGGFEPGSIYRDYQLWGGGYSYSLDGQANVSIAGNTTLTGLPSGSHWIVVFSYYYLVTGQVLGPWSVSSEPVYFTVTGTPIQTPTLSPTPSSEPTPEPEPFPTIPVAAASGVSAVIICVGLLVYFKKRKH